jgi:5-methylcytosine-specific restriction protein A
MEEVSLLVVFRCLRKSDRYDENRKWLKRGWAGWWNVAQSPDGIVNLIDTEDGSEVEVWATPGAEKIEEGGDNRWKLAGRMPFFKLATVPSAGHAFVGKGLTQDGPTYVTNVDARPDTESELLQTLSVVERKRFRLHLRAERSATASRFVKRTHGTICQACGFDPVKAHGEAGLSCIEAHHLYALSKLKSDEERVYDFQRDFAVLCSNCHRMIHRMDDPSDITAFKAFLKKKASSSKSRE